MTATHIVMAGMVLVAGIAGHPSRTAEAADLDCLIQPRETVTVSSATEGIVEQVTVDRGTLVKEGAVLAVLESSAERLAVAIARVRAEHESAIKAGEVRVSFGDRRFQRTDESYRKNLVPLKELDEAETAKILAEFELAEAQEKKALARLEYERARALLDLRTIRSPLSGVVVERLRHPGELAAKELPIVKIAQLDPLRAEVFAPIALLGKVEVGQRAVVIPEPPMSRPVEAAVTVVDRVVDAASGTFGIRLEIPNPGHRIPAGLKCKVRFGSPGR
jgi:RND family efflux transporter MFP subunit